MKSVAGAFILALVLFAAGALSWSEAQLTRQIAAAHQRLATLHYDSDDGITGTSGLLNRLPLPGSSTGDVAAERATVNYWLARYEILTPLSGSGGNRPAGDPDVLFIAANAAYRSSHPESGNPKAAVERLDNVMQAYADVLRANPNHVDAAYNYEYVARLRDTLAKGKPLPKPAKDQKQAPDFSVDLPTGPTLHGRPGGPPPELPMADFKTITPMRFDEREEQEQPGKGAVKKRRG
jgi:hypothetical protein